MSVWSEEDKSLRTASSGHGRMWLPPTVRGLKTVYLAGLGWTRGCMWTGRPRKLPDPGGPLGSWKRGSRKPTPWRGAVWPQVRVFGRNAQVPHKIVVKMSRWGTVTAQGRPGITRV